MNDIQFIPNDPENILSEAIATYSKHFGAALNPADPERIMIDLLAYRESVLRGSVEHLMRQNFVQYASAPHLDNWGALFGVVRHAGESDNDYRQRILNSPHSAIGTEVAYSNAILSLTEVCDLIFERKSDDNTLPPGVVRLTPLMKTVVNGVTCASAHNSALETLINSVIYSDSFGVVGAIFTYKNAVAVSINGTITVRPILGFNANQIIANVKHQVNQYIGALSLSFDATFGVFDLERAVLASEGVLSIANISFPNVPLLRQGEFYSVGNVTINVQ